jgi:hypothetical protein
MGPFPVLALWILFAGPGVIEGGADAVAAKGLKPALVAAWDERQPYDSSSLKGKLGNYGNE